MSTQRRVAHHGTAGWGRPAPSLGREAERLDRRWLLLPLGAVVFFVVIGGGYGFGWSWTGFGANDTVWDWLNLVLLPVALSLIPLWVASRTRYRLHWQVAGVVAVGALVVLIVGGYGLGWRWTGFHGNTLWDWLKLFLVPFAAPAVIGWVWESRHDDAPPDEAGDRVAVADGEADVRRGEDASPRAERRPTV